LPLPPGATSTTRATDSYKLVSTKALSVRGVKRLSSGVQVPSPAPIYSHIYNSVQAEIDRQRAVFFACWNECRTTRSRFRNNLLGFGKVEVKAFSRSATTSTLGVRLFANVFGSCVVSHGTFLSLCQGFQPSDYSVDHCIEHLVFANRVLPAPF